MAKYELKNIREGEVELRFTNGRKINKPLNGDKVELTIEEATKLGNCDYIVLTKEQEKKLDLKKNKKKEGEV